MIKTKLSGAQYKRLSKEKNEIQKKSIKVNKKIGFVFYF